jgi:hypothetical protein
MTTIESSGVEAMLKITEVQFSALDDDTRLRFRIRLTAWLRVHAELARDMSDEELISLIERQELRASAYQIETKRALAKWCYLAVMTAERFDQTAEVDVALKDRRLGTPPQRLDAVMAAFINAAHQRELGIR